MLTLSSKKYNQNNMDSNFRAGIKYMFYDPT